MVDHALLPEPPLAAREQQQTDRLAQEAIHQKATPERLHRCMSQPDIACHAAVSAWSASSAGRMPLCSLKHGFNARALLCSYEYALASCMSPIWTTLPTCVYSFGPSPMFYLRRLSRSYEYNEARTRATLRPRRAPRRRPTAARRDVDVRNAVICSRCSRPSAEIPHPACSVGQSSSAKVSTSHRHTAHHRLFYTLSYKNTVQTRNRSRN
jgi:hypothetical protein